MPTSNITRTDVDSLIESFVYSRNDYGDRQRNKVPAVEGYYDTGIATFVNALSNIFTLLDESKTPEEIVYAVIEDAKAKGDEMCRILNPMTSIAEGSPETNKFLGVSSLLMETKMATYGMVPYAVSEELANIHFDLYTAYSRIPMLAE